MTSEAACRPPSSAFKLNAICEKLARGPDDTPDLMAAASGDDTSAADDVTPDDVATGRGSSSSPRAPPPTSQDPASGGTTALEDDEDDDRQRRRSRVVISDGREGVGPPHFQASVFRTIFSVAKSTANPSMRAQNHARKTI